MLRRAKKKKTSAIFALLGKDEENEWWKNLFDEMADGIFPYRLSYINGSLSYINRKGKFFQLLVENQDLEELRIEIKDYIRKVVGIIPDDDIEDYSILSSATDISWKSIQRDGILREVLINKYISTLDLNKAEIAKLRSEIWWGFLVGDFSESNFEIVNNQIVAYHPSTRAPKNTRSRNDRFPNVERIPPIKMGKKPEDVGADKLYTLYLLNHPKK